MTQEETVKFVETIIEDYSNERWLTSIGKEHYRNMVAMAKIFKTEKEYKQ